MRNFKLIFFVILLGNEFDKKTDFVKNKIEHGNVHVELKRIFSFKSLNNFKENSLSFLVNLFFWIGLVFSLLDFGRLNISPDMLWIECLGGPKIGVWQRVPSCTRKKQRGVFQFWDTRTSCQKLHRPQGSPPLGHYMLQLLQARSHE